METLKQKRKKIRMELKKEITHPSLWYIPTKRKPIQRMMDCKDMVKEE
jgi:hypothetical protein